MYLQRSIFLVAISFYSDKNRLYLLVNPRQRCAVIRIHRIELSAGFCAHASCIAPVERTIFSRHAFCSRPIDLRSKEAAGLFASAQKQGGSTSTTCGMRSDPSTETAKELTRPVHLKPKPHYINNTYPTYFY